MTGQDLLDRMELLNQELQLQSGEADVTRGLLALNVAQDYFESLAAARTVGFGTGDGTVATAASTETTTFPSGVLRIDRLQLLNSSSLPELELVKLNRAGGQATSRSWPLNLLVSSTTGKPTHYWTNGAKIFWSPIPDAIHTVRWYGLQSASNISAAGTFAYPDICALPFASFAVQLLKSGLDDPTQEISGLAQSTFKSCLDALENFNRDGAVGLEYTTIHTE